MQKAGRRADMATTECTPSDTDHVADAEEMARPERFELPTTWFEVRSLFGNLLFLKVYREGARCMKCTTKHNRAQLNHANLPQCQRIQISYAI